MNLTDSLKTLTHHAYCLIGSDDVHAELISILENRHKLKIHGNPDFFDRSYANLVIDDAREIKTLAMTRPVLEGDEKGGLSSGTNLVGKKVFVIKMNSITVEAQNALLKLLEEPAEYALFFLIVPSAHLLLPTVKSRLHVVTPSKWSGDMGKDATGAAVQKNDAAEAEAFLKTPVGKRLDLVKSLIDAISKEKKTKQDAIDFLNALEATVYSKAHSGESKAGIAANRKALEAIATARGYADDRAPSMKMLLEYVALNC